MEFEKDDEVCILDCNHCYHTDCIAQWLKHSKVPSWSLQWMLTQLMYTCHAFRTVMVLHELMHAKLLHIHCLCKNIMAAGQDASLLA